MSTVPPVQTGAMSKIGPYLKTFGPSLLALGQLVYALKTKGTITEEELKTFGALALAAFATWAVPAPNYSAPGQVVVDQNDPRLRPADGGVDERGVFPDRLDAGAQNPIRSSSRYPARTIRETEDTELPQDRYGWRDEDPRLP